MDGQLTNILDVDAAGEATFTVGTLARRLIQRYDGAAVDVALALVREVSFQTRLDALVHRDHAQPASNGGSTVPVVTKTVCDYFGLAMRDLYAKRDRRTARARQFAWALLLERGGFSLSEIGKGFGKHHTTVLKGCERVDRQSQDWAALSRRLDAANVVECA